MGLHTLVISGFFHQGNVFQLLRKKNVKWERKDRFKNNNKAKQKILTYFKIKNEYSQMPSK